jgi:CBS domain-containing protein
MRAADVMTAHVVTVRPDTEVRHIAETLLQHRISAVPVVDDEGRLLGIVSEGDLVHRLGDEKESRRSWWLALFRGVEERQATFVKTHGKYAHEVMTRNVVSVKEDTELPDIVRLLERHGIKRVPVVRDGRVLGIVSRANLLHGLVARQAPPAKPADAEVRASIYAELARAGVRPHLANIVVSQGTAHLWGAARSIGEREAIRVAAEDAPGVERVEDHLIVLSQGPE